MPTPPVDPDKYARKFFAEIEKQLALGHFPHDHPEINGRDRRSAVRLAGVKMGFKLGTINGRYQAACRALGRKPNWKKWKRDKAATPYKASYEGERADPHILLLHLLKRRSMVTLDEVVGVLQLPHAQAEKIVARAIDMGINIRRYGQHYALERNAEPAFASGELPIYTSRKDNTFVFGLTSDNHMGSKYERPDCLEDIYDRFAREKVDRAFNCGNWIEGESRFNRTDVAVHGMDAQIAHLVKGYPQRKGITTYAVAGDDHEGWYAQREGIDIGRYAENRMREAGRRDWVNLGYMEAHVRLVNANTGKQGIAAFVHPGGGSAYADSYAIQKILESLDGGEKPNFAAYGHYHKMLSGEYRNVWWVNVPSTKDQDIFMRKHKLRSVVGGGIITLEQDPATGAITGMTPKLWRYFNKDYYNNRWSHSGPVVLPTRATT